MQMMLFYVKKSFDLVFILSNKVDWVVTSPCSTEIVAPVRETKENMPLGQLKKGILNPKRYPMAFEHRKWVTANKKMFDCDKEHD